MNDEKDKEIEKLKVMAWNLKRVPFLVREHIVEILDGKKNIRPDFIEALNTYKKEIDENWPEELKAFLFSRLIELKELPAEYLKKTKSTQNGKLPPSEQ